MVLQHYYGQTCTRMLLLLAAVSGISVKGDIGLLGMAKLSLTKSYFL